MPVHFELAGGVAALEGLRSSVGLPRGAEVEQVDEEVVGQRPALGEHPVRGLPGVGAQHPQTAHQHGHLGSGQGQQVGPVDQQVLRRPPLALAEVVAEPVGGRLQGRERLDVGLLLRGVGATRGERDLDVVAGVARRLLDARRRRPARSGRRARPACRRPALNGCPDALEGAQHGASSSGSLTSQPLCGSRRMRAPLAPPRLSLPRNVDADAHAVATSWETVRPEARTCSLSAAMSSASISSWSTAGTGSCQSSVSCGTSGPR